MIERRRAIALEHGMAEPGRHVADDRRRDQNAPIEIDRDKLRQVVQIGGAKRRDDDLCEAQSERRAENRYQRGLDQ